MTEEKVIEVSWEEYKKDPRAAFGKTNDNTVVVILSEDGAVAATVGGRLVSDKLRNEWRKTELQEEISNLCIDYFVTYKDNRKYALQKTTCYQKLIVYINELKQLKGK